MHKLKEERGDFAINGAFILILVFAALALALAILLWGYQPLPQAPHHGRRVATLYRGAGPGG